jgi:hypothetical protein
VNRLGSPKTKMVDSKQPGSKYSSSQEG